MLMLGRIDQPEVLEHEAALLGSEPGQLFPGGIAELRTGARGPGGEHARQMDAVTDGRAAHSLFLIVRLGAREGAARVEQPAVQPALALDRLAVEPAGLELAGELARLLGEGPRGGASARGLQPLELLGQRALAGRERAQLLEHGLTAQAHQRQQSLRLPVQPALRFGEARELLHRLGEPRARARARDLATAPRQRQRRGVQGVDRLARERGGGRGVGLSLLQLLARRRHLALREAERALELRRDERVPAGGIAWRRRPPRAPAPRRPAAAAGRAPPSPTGPDRARPVFPRATPAPASRAGRAVPRVSPRVRFPPRRRSRPRHAHRPPPRHRRPAPSPAGRAAPRLGTWPAAAPRAPRRPRGRGPAPPGRSPAPANPPAPRAHALPGRRPCRRAAHPRGSTRPDVAAALPHRRRATPARPRRPRGGTARRSARAPPSAVAAPRRAAVAPVASPPGRAAPAPVAGRAAAAPARG